MTATMTDVLVDGPGDVEAFNRWAMENRWSDGLPLLPPTPQRVEQAVRASGRDASEVVMRVPPNWADATVEKVAANAVMAGCPPHCMPIVVAALQALAHPACNLYGSQATTHCCTAMVMVSGPLAAQAGMHWGSGAFGPGLHSNGAIGRAVRLALQNIGGAYAGEADRSTQGGPAKYTFCFAENEVDSPWPPLRVDLGFAPEDSTVTVLSAEAPHNINDHVSDEPRGLLLTFAQTIATMGKNNAYCRNSDYLVAFGPEHAAILGRHGWSRRDVQSFLYERARIPYRLWSAAGMIGMLPMPHHFTGADGDFMVPMTDRPEDVLLFVAGGPGRHSSWIPSIGIGRSHTARIEDARGERLTQLAR
jgi:hypothetical protein